MGASVNPCFGTVCLVTNAYVVCCGVVGGRFVPPDLAERYGLTIPAYFGAEQSVELPSTAQPTKDTRSEL